MFTKYIQGVPEKNPLEKGGPTNKYYREVTLGKH